MYPQCNGNQSVTYFSRVTADFLNQTSQIFLPNLTTLFLFLRLMGRCRTRPDEPGWEPAAVFPKYQSGVRWRQQRMLHNVPFCRICRRIDRENITWTWIYVIKFYALWYWRWFLISIFHSFLLNLEISHDKPTSLLLVLFKEAAWIMLILCRGQTWRQTQSECRSSVTWQHPRVVMTVITDASTRVTITGAAG